MYFYDIFVFFSSRRRHTRLQGDWSSDVCSSDLHGELEVLVLQAGDPRRTVLGVEGGQEPLHRSRQVVERSRHAREARVEIGRASCRERVWCSMGGERWKET